MERAGRNCHGDRTRYKVYAGGAVRNDLSVTVVMKARLLPQLDTLNLEVEQERVAQGDVKFGKILLKEGNRR